jgi:hypothetical protein
MSTSTVEQVVDGRAAAHGPRPGDVAEMVVCPVCGTANDPDAVFCSNSGCGKALGEFRYVGEELAAGTRWHERLAFGVTAFVGRPHYVLGHVVWFALWIAVNTGVVLAGQAFDRYPFNLLGILLSIESILVSGFVLISQNRQAAHADKRAELDYEVNVRTYREIREIRAALRELEGRSLGDPLGVPAER